MIFNNEQEVITYIKANEQVKPWVIRARENSKMLNALVYGIDFDKYLIEKIESIESTARATARKKYSKDIRDLFSRVMQIRENVFSAFGGAPHVTIESKSVKKKLAESLNNFKGQKSIKKYLSENFFQLGDVDPNGIMFLEYLGDTDIYPTYKSINDIRTYESDGSLLKVLLFEPKTVKVNSQEFKEWRVVDEKKDWRILQRGGSFSVREELTFEFPFSNIPGIILSDKKDVGSEIRYSSLFPIVELAKDYARDKSVNTIYKFIHGFVRHWRYEKQCKSCAGLGLSGDGKEECGECKGIGYVRKNDVTDITIIDIPREGDPVIAPNLEGFVQPALDTWQQYNDDLKNFEQLIKSTMWGTEESKREGNETATGRFIDIQPITTRLTSYTDSVEWAENQFIHWTEDWINTLPKEEYGYFVTYGRRYIIESPDVILERYTKERDKGANNTILDKLLDEYLLSVHQSNPVLLLEIQKKREVEPYIHQSIKEVFDIFGATEANKKVLFVSYWEDVDVKKDVSTLKTEFNTYAEANKFTPPVTETVIN